MAENIGGVQYELGVDMRRLKSGFSEADRAAKASGRRVESAYGKGAARGIGAANKQAQGLRGTLASPQLRSGLVAGLGLGAGAVGFLAAAKGIGLVKDAIGGTISAAADFEQAMTRSTAIMGDLSDTMRDDMATAAREVAKSTTFSAEQAADSFFYLASAGLDAEQSIGALPQVADFATAGMFDLSRATDLLTDAQSALGLTTDDTSQNMENMARVSDVLVRANTLANASVEQFSTALTSKAGAALKAFGIDLEEGVAVLAAFADQGVKAEEAGNALDRMLRLLPDLAVKNADAFRQMGIEVFDTNGEVNNLGTIVDQLSGALSGLSDRQVQVALGTLGFQARVQGLIKPLLGTGKAIKEYEKELRNAGGTTADVADKQLENFNDKMTILGSAIEDIALDWGPVLIDGILAIGDAAGTTGRELDRWFKGQIGASTASELLANKLGIEHDMLLTTANAIKEAQEQTERLARQEQALAADGYAVDYISEADRQYMEYADSVDEGTAAVKELSAEEKLLAEAGRRVQEVLARQGTSGWAAATGAAGDAAAGAADDVEDLSSALQDFKDNIDDFDDVRSLDKVEKAIGRQRKAIRQASKDGDYAAWARHKARLRDLRDESRVSQAAKDAFEEARAQQQARREQLEKTNKVIRSQASKHDLTAKEVRRILNDEGGDVDKLKGRLRAMADGKYEPEVNVRIESAQRAIDKVKLALKNIKDEQVYIDIAERGGRAGGGGGSGRGHVLRHGGGWTRANSDYVIKQDEAWLTTGSSPGRVIPLDQMRNTSSSKTTSLTVNINAGAFLGSANDADRFAQRVAPAIGRELTRIGA